MSTHIYRIVLAAMMSLSFEVAFAATITGAQCKEHFKPLMRYMFNVDQADELKYVNAHTGPVTVKSEASTYVSNIVDAPLSSTLTRIENIKTDNSKVLSFQNLIKKTLDGCHKHCQGLALSNGSFVRCEKVVKNASPLDIRLGLTKLNNGTTAKLEEPKAAPDASAAFENRDKGTEFFEDFPAHESLIPTQSVVTTPVVPVDIEDEKEAEGIFDNDTIW